MFSGFTGLPFSYVVYLLDKLYRAQAAGEACTVVFQNVTQSCEAVLARVDQTSYWYHLAELLASRFVN